MNLDALEKFVMDTIDVILANPEEYESEAVKSTVAYRFGLYRQLIQGGRLGHAPHRPPEIEVNNLKEELRIPKPKTHIIPRKSITTFTTKDGVEK